MSARASCSLRAGWRSSGRVVRRAGGMAASMRASSVGYPTAATMAPISSSDGPTWRAAKGGDIAALAKCVSGNEGNPDDGGGDARATHVHLDGSAGRGERAREIAGADGHAERRTHGATTHLA